MASTHQLNRTLDVSGTHRYMFFTSSSGVNRTKKGRQALTRRTVGRSSSLGNSHSSNYSRTTESNSSAILLTTQSSSTQTDMRDSEIQTDPWWHRSEGVPLLCCRGSHRKLEKAKWNARACLGVFANNPPEEDQDVTLQESLTTLTLDDTSTSTQTFGTTTASTQRTVSCGPSYGSRACFPDPLDLWVSTYQKLRVEDEIEEEKISAKRHRLLKRQESRAVKRAKQLAAESSHTPNRKNDLLSNRRHKSLLPNLPACVPKLDNVTLVEALDRLCRQLHQHSLISAQQY